MSPVGGLRNYGAVQRSSHSGAACGVRLPQAGPSLPREGPSTHCRPACKGRKPRLPNKWFRMSISTSG